MDSVVMNASTLIGGTLSQAVGNPIFLGILFLMMLLIVIVVLRFTWSMSALILVPAVFLLIPMLPILKIIFALVFGYFLSRALIKMFRGE